MATTGLDIVTGALKRLRVIASNETPSAEDAKDGLAALNDMMFALKVDNVNTHWTELTLAGEFPLDPEHVQGVKAMLAVRVAEDFGKPVGPKLAEDAENGEQLLRADYGYVRPLKADTMLRATTSQRRYA